MLALEIVAAFAILAVVAGFAFWQGRVTQRAGTAAHSSSSDPADTPPDDVPLFVALSRAIDDGLLVVEHDRRISFANEGVGELVGRIRVDLRGETLMVAVRDYQADRAVEQAFETGEPQTTTFHLPRTGRTLRLSCQPLDGGNSRVVVVLRDMTQLAQLERARREMVANVSHELATPLASVRLLVETLASEPPPDIARRMLGQIDDELTQMTQLIDELRELSQIESGRMAITLGRVAVAKLVERAIERLRPQAERREITVGAELPEDLPPILVDEDRIGQVLLNLLHNALKWTPPGGSVTVLAAPAVPRSDERTARELEQVEGPGWLKLSVRDTGIGIPAAETERVFERFYKVDRARTRDRSGTGLGLAITKHLVERHGGRIWVESREGHGSTFSILLPTADDR